MFVLQAYAQKPGEQEDAQPAARNKKKPLAESDQAPTVLTEQIPIAKTDIDAVFRKKGISEFITTLTPGAQNAIYAASAAWGYENAAKYVKNAMKLEEVKNAIEPSEKGRAVLENVQSQAQAEQPETAKETSKFVWGFYNDDLKETQAQSAKSEHITEKQRFAKQELVIPATAPLAVAASLSSGSQDPSLLYCTSSQQALDSMRQQQAAEEKKEELARLVIAPRERQKAASLKRSLEGKKRAEVENEAASLALERRQEVIEEYERTEKKLSEAIQVLDQSSTDGKEEMKKAANMLPSEICRMVLRRDTLMAKRRALRAQLVKWMAFCTGGRQSLLSMPSSRLLKLAALSSLLKLGK